MLGHLVQNAIEATPETGTVNVIMETQGDTARITVQDSGQGMDEEFIREKLFRPFETTKTTGMGIGAHECQEYVRELRGELSVVSQVNLGTTFTVSLPQRKAVAQEMESPNQGVVGG